MGLLGIFLLLVMFVTHMKPFADCLWVPVNKVKIKVHQVIRVMGYNRVSSVIKGGMNGMMMGSFHTSLIRVERVRKVFRLLIY